MRNVDCIERTTPEDCVALMKSDNVMIIDVRDRDYMGGHISGSINIPAYLFLSRSNARSLADRCESDHVNHIFFHCMYSQQRGPRCASYFYGVLKEKHPHSTLKVHVLSGGFAGFAFIYRDSDLLVDFDRKHWQDEDGSEL